MTTNGEGQATSLTLLERLRRKEIDQEAWNRFVRVYTPVIYARCLRAGLTAADADDVAQEVYDRLFKSIGEFERCRTGSFRKYFGQCIQWEVSSWRRKQANQREVLGDSRLEETPAPGPDEAEPIQPSEIRQSVWELARQHFRGADKTWQSFVLRKKERLSAKDVAGRLGMNEGAVNTATSRVSKWVNEELADLLEKEEEA